MTPALSWLGASPPLVAGATASRLAIGSVFLRLVFCSTKDLIEVKRVEWGALAASSKQFVEVVLIDATSLSVSLPLIAESIGIAKLSVVFLALLRMVQDAIGFLNLEEHRTGRRIGIDIRMVFRCLPMIGFLNLNSGGIAGNFPHGSFAVA
jgi:hypothetical protein